MVLNVIERGGDAFAGMRHLLTDNHESRPAQLKHIRRTIAIYRALRNAGIVEQTGDGAIQVTNELQLNFALNQPLSPFAVAATELLDTASPGYALDVVSIIEATLEDPRQILYAQQNKAKAEAVAQMKADGIEYDERMALLENVTHPKPLAELLEAAFFSYRQSHPWVDEHRLAPKSVVRDMFERAMTFVEYVGFYSLSRSEGLVLRYLADAYKALRQTVPEDAKTEELIDLIEWLGELVRQVDSSLIDEWERLRNPTDEPTTTGGLDADLPPAVTGNVRAFRVLVRNALFRRVELASLRRYYELGDLDSDSGWTADAWAQALEPYFDTYTDLGAGSDARGPGMLIIEVHRDKWTVRQIFDDPAGDHDWGISAEIDLAASDEVGAAVVKITEVGPR
jgi:hypothetical protein